MNKNVETSLESQDSSNLKKNEENYKGKENQNKNQNGVNKRPSSEQRKKYFFSLPEKKSNALDYFLLTCNEKDLGATIRLSDVIEGSLCLFDKAFKEKLQQESLSISDKIKLEHIKYNEKKGTKISLDEFLAQKLKIT